MPASQGPAFVPIATGVSGGAAAAAGRREEAASLHREQAAGPGRAAAWPDRGEHVGGGACCGEERHVIVPPAGVRVLIATKPVYIRAGMDRLAAIAKEALAEDFPARCWCACSNVYLALELAGG